MIWCTCGNSSVEYYSTLFSFWHSERYASLIDQCSGDHRYHVTMKINGRLWVYVVVIWTPLNRICIHACMHFHVCRVSSQTLRIPKAIWRQDYLYFCNYNNIVMSVCTLTSFTLPFVSQIAMVPTAVNLLESTMWFSQHKWMTSRKVGGMKLW